MIRAAQKLKHQKYHLHIPLITPKSLSQLRNSMREFINDPLVPKFPPEAYTRVRDFNLHVAFLYLETPRRVEAAIQFLRCLNLQKILNGLTVPTFRRLHNSPNLNVPPLRVRVNSLISPHKDTFVAPGEPFDFSQCRTLFVEIFDLSPGPYLKPFRLALRALLNDAGFLDKDEEKGNSLYPHNRFLDLRQLEKLTPEAFVRLESEYKSLVTFDATEIVSRYHRFQWTEPFPLERLCLARRNHWSNTHPGRKPVRNKEIISVPFPWASEIGVTMNKDHDLTTFGDLAMYELTELDISKVKQSL